MKSGVPSGPSSIFPGAALLLSGVLLAFPVQAHADEVDSWTYAYAGLQHFYNLEYEKAISYLEKAIEQEPNNPFFHSFLANTILFRQLLRTGQLEGNLYGASNTFLKTKKPKAEPDEIARFKQELARARELSRQRLAENPRDTDALYILGVTYATEGNYKFTIEKSWFDALRAGGKANKLHEKVLKLDPEYHDAKLVPGVYQYVVGSIPRSVKWLAFLFGFSGSKTKGIALLHEAMAKGKFSTSDASFLMAIIYNREKRYDYARQLFARLGSFYPRNPLLQLEIGRSYVREGKKDEALQQYLAVARDVEAGKEGYSLVPAARLWYEIGNLYQEVGRFPEALEAYAQVTGQEEQAKLLIAYSAVRRGEIFAAQKELRSARAEYERAAAMPYPEPRRLAKKRLRSLSD